MTRKTKAPNRYRYVVFWNDSEHYCEAATEAEACKSAASAWAAELKRTERSLWLEILVDATVVRLRKLNN